MSSGRIYGEETQRHHAIEQNSRYAEFYKLNGRVNYMDASPLVIWGRSGVGKTTLAVNLACALAKTRCVGLISSNLQYGHLQSCFGQTIQKD